MKRVLCIFAHPDDESFGPGGTIALWAKQGAVIHLLCATRGESGNNHTDRETAKIRSRELTKSSKVLGIQNVNFLGFMDGHICNNDLQILMKKITKKVKSFKPDILMTFDLNGVSGHIDHVAVASAVTKVFHDTGIAKKLFYYNVSRRISDQEKDYFIHFPDGLTPEQTDETIDISSVYEVKVKAMYCHKTQIADIKAILSLHAPEPRKEYFKVRSKRTK